MKTRIRQVLAISLTSGALLSFSSGAAQAHEQKFSACTTWKPLNGHNGALARECLYGVYVDFTLGATISQQHALMSSIEIKNNSASHLLLSQIMTGVQYKFAGSDAWRQPDYGPTFDNVEPNKVCGNVTVIPPSPNPESYFRCETHYIPDFGSHREDGPSVRGRGVITTWDSINAQWDPTVIVSPVKNSGWAP